MRAVRGALPWLLLAVALAAWWPRPAATVAVAPEEALPPPEVDKAVAMATVSLPPPPAAPAPAAALAPVPTAAPAPATAVASPPPQPASEPEFHALEPVAAAPAPALPAIKPLVPTADTPAAAPPQIVALPARLAPPKPRPAPPPAVPQRQAAAPPPPPATAAPSAPVMAAEDGRALLRLLEHGRGPQISIDWPGGAEQARLAAQLARCHGMRVALLDEAGRLWRADDPAGQSWQANLDRLSGFLRVGAGDADAARRIRARHGVSGQPVRLFPRAVDAHLLASLRQAVGAGYAAAGRIGLRYRLDTGRVVLDGIRVDGRPVPGVIRLAGTGHCGA